MLPIAKNIAMLILIVNISHGRQKFVSFSENVRRMDPLNHVSQAKLTELFQPMRANFFGAINPNI